MATTYPRITGVSPTQAALDAQYFDVSGDTVTGVYDGDDTTNSTAVTNGSIHTEGGLGVTLDTFMGGDLDVAGHIAIGNNAAVDTKWTVNLNETAADISASKVGLLFFQTTTGDAGTYDTTGIQGNAVLSAGTANATGDFTGISSGAGVTNSGFTTSLIRGFYNRNVVIEGTVTKVYGLHLDNAINLGTITNQYGIWIEDQTSGSNNYGIVLDGDGAGADIVFGATQDSSIYHSTYLTLDSDGGVQIGTGATQEIGLFGVTPVQQPAGTGENTGYSAVGGTNVDHQDTFTGNTGSSAYTINDIVKALKNLGVLAA